MFDAQHVSSVLIAKFERRAPLNESDRAALAALPWIERSFGAHAYLAREGEKVETAKVIVDGFVYRHKVTVEGARQILGIHIPGDFVDLESSLLNEADHNVQALTACTVAEVPLAIIKRLIHDHGVVAHAMWIDTLIDASIYREWVLNVGRRSARKATAHLLCEFGRRLEHAGLSSHDCYEFPLTQEQMADALGLTSVHVNRTLKEMNTEGLIKRSGRSVTVLDPEKLARLGGFNDRYLHLRLLSPLGLLAAE